MHNLPCFNFRELEGLVSDTAIRSGPLALLYNSTTIPKMSLVMKQWTCGTIFDNEENERLRIDICRIQTPPRPIFVEFIGLFSLDINSAVSAVQKCSLGRLSVSGCSRRREMKPHDARSLMVPLYVATPDHWSHNRSRGQCVIVIKSRVTHILRRLQ